MTKRDMKCEEVLRHLIAYLDREMDEETAAHIERHLEECRGCFSRAAFEKKLKGEVRATASRKSPERLRARIKNLLDSF
jgi:anti-sigma factor (TIGR02949 family)